MAARLALTGLLLLAMPSGGVASEALEQPAFPTRTIKIMAPANPGGGWDQLARLIQHTLREQKIVGVPVEVINRGGAGGTIGLAELVARHRGDPYVIMIGGGVLVGSELTHGSPFSLRETTRLARLASEYEVIAVPANSPFRDLQSLLEAFRETPAAISWGGGSAGGLDHVLVGLIADSVGIDPARINYVAFPGGGDAAAAIMGGKVTAGISGLAEWEGLAASGRMRLLAISAPRRIGDGSIPTLIESGVDVSLENWRGVFAAPGIGPAERDWYLRTLAQLRATEAWREILRRNSWEDTFLAGAEFDEFLDLEYEHMRAILDRIGLGHGGQGYAVVGPYFFPAVIGAGLLLSLLMMGLAGRRASIAARRSPAVPGHDAFIPLPKASIATTGEPNWPRFGFGAGLTLAYILLLLPLGFLVATPLFIVAQARVIGSRQLRRDAVVALLLTAAIYGAFRHLLTVEVP